MLEKLLFPLVAVLGSLLGSIYDLRTREVPDWINYFMIIFGLGGYLIISILEWSVRPFLYSLAAVLVFYGIAALMFYSGQWGGGDAKMLIGFGALLPIYPFVLLDWFSPITGLWPFAATLFFNIILVGGVLGFSIMLFLILKHSSAFSNEFRLGLEKYRSLVRAIFFVLIIPVVTYFFSRELFFASLLSWVAIILLVLSFLAAKAIEKTCMIKAISPSKLTIGDWLANDVKVGNKIVLTPKGTGLTEEDVKKLVKLSKERKLRMVNIKIGIPFVPSFLLGLLISLAFGDLIFIMISGVL